MKIKHIGIIALMGVAGWLSFTAFSTKEKAPHCVPREGAEYCIAHSGEWPVFTPGESQPYSFFIIGKNGMPVTKFALAHEKLMHLIVVRKDLNEFMHLHPTLNEKTGQFSLTDFALPTAGAYRIFTDFTPEGKENAVVSEDVGAGDTSLYPPVEQLISAMESADEGYTVKLTASPTPTHSGAMTTLSFAITKDGVPVTDLEPYLGAMAHAVIIRNGTLDYVHTHPHEESEESHESFINTLIPIAMAHGLGSHQTGTVSVMTTFPLEGDYKIFFQIKHKGVVQTLTFALPVLYGEASGHAEMHNM